MKSIPATKGFTILVDDEDAWLSARKWFASPCGHKGNQHWRPSAWHPLLGRVMNFHRHIVSPFKGYVVDHINGDPWDNRRANLRICTQAENSRNRKRDRRNTSGYKGVRVRRDGYGFDVRINFDRKAIFVGTFADKIEAARAFDEAARKYHGEFARLNFPQVSA
jgi:hypothetical protein